MVTDNGAIRLPDGRAFASPSRAAMEAGNVPAYDGWYAWTVVRVGKRLNDLRHALHELAVRENEDMALPPETQKLPNSVWDETS